MNAPDDEFGTIIPYFLGINHNTPHLDYSDWLNGFDLSDSNRCQVVLMICLNAESLEGSRLSQLAPFIAETIKRAIAIGDFDFIDNVVTETELRLAHEPWEVMISVTKDETLTAFFNDIAGMIHTHTQELDPYHVALTQPTGITLERILQP